MIRAKRGAQRQEFPIQVWNEMPKGRYGWIPETDVPEEVLALQNKASQAQTDMPAITGLVITQEMMDANPGLSFIGVQVGDTIDFTINGVSVGDKMKDWVMPAPAPASDAPLLGTSAGSDATGENKSTEDENKSAEETKTANSEETTKPGSAGPADGANSKTRPTKKA